MNKKLTKKELDKLRKNNVHLGRLLKIRDMLPKLIETHKEVFDLLEECIDTNKKDFDITLNNRRFVSSIPFNKEEVKILYKQRRSFLRYVMSMFYKGLIKGKEDPDLILEFFLLANPQNYVATKSDKPAIVSDQEKLALQEKKGAYNGSAILQIKVEREFRKDNSELYKLKE